MSDMILSKYSLVSCPGFTPGMNPPLRLRSSAILLLGTVMIQAANLSMADHFFGTFAGALRAFFVVLFIYGVVSIFSPILPSDWLRESYAMRGAAVVWPPVARRRLRWA